MSKPKPTPKRPAQPTVQAKPLPSTAKRGSFLAKSEGVLLFTRKNYILIGIGLVVMLLGFILMSGGSMPSPDVWDKDLIYSTRRTVIAPILVVAGLVIEIVAIFARETLAKAE
ncbi:MAG: DUF3098 domain-containing protein [Saprospiraceae bacterium]